jgi:short subunit fatty acids transporter
MDEETARAAGKAAEEAAEQAAVEAALRLREEAKAAETDPATQEEWIRQSNLIYGGLGAAGLVAVQPFLTTSPLDLTATICVVAFAVAIPLLAALLLLNRQEAFRRQVTRSRMVSVAKSLAEGASFVGLTAAFWHISQTAGITFLVSGFFAVGVHSAGYTKLEYDGSFRARFARRKA